MKWSILWMRWNWDGIKHTVNRIHTMGRQAKSKRPADLKEGEGCPHATVPSTARGHRGGWSINKWSFRLSSIRRVYNLHITNECMHYAQMICWTRPHKQTLKARQNELFFLISAFQPRTWQNKKPSSLSQFSQQRWRPLSWSQATIQMVPSLKNTERLPNFEEPEEKSQWAKIPKHAST